MNPVWDGWQLTYDLLDPAGQVVVDVGAGRPDSVAYWLGRGALQVYAYEKDPSDQAYLVQKYANDPRVKLMGGWQGEPLPLAGILKTDCEGCEASLSWDELLKFAQWSVALHRSTYDMRSVLLTLGGRLAFVTPDRAEEVYVKS